MSNNDKKDELESQDKTQIAQVKNKDEDGGGALVPCLTQLSGSGSGQVFNLNNASFKIGRDRSCEIWIEDPHISRVHALVSHEGEDTLIVDQGSTNGVFVNGKKVEKCILKNGDRILIGTRLFFKYSLEFADYQKIQHQKYIQANCDSLTKLYNKRFFTDIISKEFSYSKRTKSPLSLLMLDIDHFKKINDTYGHLLGDTVLARVGEVIKKSVRHENIACRFGGEEFVIILRNTGPLAAELVAERIRKSIESYEIAGGSNVIKVTVSIGIATYDHHNFETFEELIKFADELLYESKLKGRNRTTLKKAA